MANKVSKVNKKALVLAILFGISVSLAQVSQLIKVGKNGVVIWQYPTVNEDGSALTDLAGLELYLFNSGSTPGVDAHIYTTTISDISVTERKVIDLLTSAGVGAGVFAISAIAFDEFGNKSDWAVPVNFQAKVVSPGKVVIEVLKSK